MVKIKTRKQIKDTDKWDLSLLYANDQTWEYGFVAAKKKIIRFEKMKDKFVTKEEIKNCLDSYFSLQTTVEKLYNYAQRKFDVDVAQNESNICLNRVRDLNSLFGEKTIFVYIFLSKKSVNFLNSLFKDEKFKNYKFFIQKIIREKEHILSEAEEAILAKLGETSSYSANVFGKINNSDLKFPEIKKDGKKIQITSGNFVQLLQGSDRGLRKEAMQKVFSAYKAFRETLSQNLFQHIKQNTLLAKIRRYDSAIASFSFGDDITSAVYENLFQEANDHLYLLHRYGRLIKKSLGYDKLYWHDLYVPLVQNGKDEVSYDQAVEMVLESIKPLGDDYAELARIALKKERWVDRYPNHGKQSGAYSSVGFEGPAYILMNFNGTLSSVSTLAHELGHSMHTRLSAQNQAPSNYSYPIFLAEIASIFNENLLFHYLSKNGDKKTRIFIINKQLEEIRQTFFRQTMFAEFEKKLYDYVEGGGALTSDFLEKEYYELNKKYYGPGVEIDRLVASEWSRIPHFFYNFYVYKYATGLAISNYFFNSVINGGPQELNDYLNLLKSGGTDFPLSLLKKSGFNINDSGYIKILMQRFEILLNELESELGNKNKA
jgi:oligoendopeptidase F